MLNLLKWSDSVIAEDRFISVMEELKKKKLV
jgi:hypothetical protein